MAYSRVAERLITENQSGAEADCAILGSQRAGAIG
jgi:hypothetical protein